jgi:spore coat protein U-like protein
LSGLGTAKAPPARRACLVSREDHQELNTQPTTGVNRIMRKLSLVMCTAAGLALSAHSAAQTATGSFNVTATVQAACQVLNTNDLVFGGYDPLAATDLTGSTTFQVRCTRNAGNFIALSEGANGNATSCLGRAMNGPGADDLAYDLLNGATPWGCGANQVSYTAAVNSPVTFTVNGSIPAGQFVQAGAYSDTITITVDF